MTLLAPRFVLPSFVFVTSSLALATVACSETAPPAGSGGTLASGGAPSSGGGPGASGGATGSGGDVGSGGAPSAGGVPSAGGAPGTGGELGSGGEAASGGAASGGAGGVDCSALPVCDDFESVTAGMPPDPATWTTELNYGNNGSPTLVAISTEDARSPSQSVRVAGNDTAPWNFQYAAPGETFYTRAYFKTGDPGSSGTALIGIGLKNDHGDEIRLRLFNGKITINAAAGGDGLAPNPFDCTACIDVPVDTWFCAEMFYDGTTDTARIWIDDTLAAEVVNNVGWHSTGSFPATAERIWFGTLAPNGAAPTVFVDDVAIGPARIGCL